MALAVIGAGFGRTGTESMKLALERLGLGPCHHMKEVLASPEQRAIWRAIAGGGAPDWDQALAGYRSAVDWPSSYYWRALGAHWPKAKIVLTWRDSESWYRSMEKTILKTLKTSTDPASLGLALIAARVFDGRLDDRDHIIAAYERNTTEVEAAFGRRRLLIHRLGDGWAPLCRFLGKPIPDTPYPRTNSTAEFEAMTAAMSKPAN